MTADRTLATCRSIEFDALLVAGGTTPTGDIKLVVLRQETFCHCKAIGVWGDGASILTGVGITDGPGVLTAAAVDKQFTAALAGAVSLHRAWVRPQR